MADREPDMATATSLAPRRGTADRKTPFRLLLALFVIVCAVLDVLVLTGNSPWSKPVSPSADWVSPTRYAQQPDNPMAPRNKVLRIRPDQFDVVTTPKFLAQSAQGNIVVRPDRVEMFVGNRLIWSGAFSSVPGFDGRPSLPDVAALVGRGPHPDWLRQTAPAVFELSAGLVQATGTVLEIAAPEVRELRLLSARSSALPPSYVAGVGATGVFRDVTVTSWLPGIGPDPDPANHRPFVSYDSGGRLDISGSELAYLGADASKAYGVSWGTGTTGRAVGSVFHHNLFGAYTGGAVGVEFRDNVFRNNSRYGLDPHTNSSGLIVVGNEAYANNTHGIIFSKSVTRSVVAGNKTHDNGSNGIMMDEKCDFNVIRDNESWNNRGDGIVLQGSSHNVVLNNRVSGNEVGVRVNANHLGPTDGSRVTANQITGNRLGIQVYGGARDTQSQGNVITDSADQAIQFAEAGVSQSDTVRGAGKAVVIKRSGVTLRDMTMSDVGRGVVLADGVRATVESSRVSGRDIAVEVGQDAHLSIRDAGPNAPSTVTGARKALVVGGTADLRGVAIDNVERGVVVESGGHATITTASVVTGSKGVEVEGFNGRSRVNLLSSEVRAPQPVVGSTLWQQSGNELSAIPSWLSVSGAVFVLLATLLHVGRRVTSPTASPRHRWHPGPLVAPDGAASA